MNTVLIGKQDVIEKMYDQDVLNEISQLVDSPIDVFYTNNQDQIIGQLPGPDTEIIFCTWGMTPLTAEVLAKLPKLKAVFYAAGSVKCFATDAFWKQNITLSHAALANAVPVAEFALASIILGNKKAFNLNQSKQFGRGDHQIFYGNFGSKVGLIGYGAIARHLRQLLKPFELEVLIYDPFLSDEAARKDDMTKVDLDQIFTESTAVSLHAPNLDSTQKMIREEHFLKMLPSSTFINTARGALIDEPGMIRALQQRPDIQAVIDVTFPEPPDPNSPLFTLPNVFITPHIAGAMGNEWGRLVHYMIQDCQRFLNNQPLKYQVKAEMMATMA